MMRKVGIEKEEIIRFVYFGVSLFQQENFHRQGTSSKSDYIGGYLDRWINRVPESLVLNKLILPEKDFEVVPDFFIYNARAEKNAPDVLGIKLGDRVLPFVEFDERTWVPKKGMPYIEVKSFRKNQKLVTVRETQLEDDRYYVFVEIDLNPDYLVCLFEKEFFDPQIVEFLKMDDCFIKSNPERIIYQPPPVKVPEKEILGSLSLITVVKGSDLKKISTRCREKEGVFYVKDIEKKDQVRQQNMEAPFEEIFPQNQFNGTFGSEYNEKKMLPMACSQPQNIDIVKINKGSFYIKTKGKCRIFDFELSEGNYYKVEIAEFERSSDWVEYVALKNQFSSLNDRTKELKEELSLLFEKFFSE